MGLFSKKEKMDLLQKTQYNLEQSQKNMEALALQMPVEKKEVSVAESSENESKESITPIMAAYALNLCTVSVTQIIDYMDLNIMEQEYEMILNNLNLQNMPDDDALLDILKQILNTVTFFKIDQKEREFVERDYQQKMKNAVWSAIPNVGALITTGLSKNPVMMAVSLTASVGTAYMNYRKQKADNLLAHEKELWQLEKSAIEQFDGLKRELFDTAWRLSKHFGFEDQLRLSERQIHQYNSILMDTDDDRRYERLEAIADCFEAYPPFWYQFGHTANLIALSVRDKIEEKKSKIKKIETDRIMGTNNNGDEIYKELLIVKREKEELKKIEKEYNEKAKKHFEKFQAKNKFGLLREDKIASMCDLEYVELLLRKGGCEESDLLIRLKNAANKAGNSLEIIQLCIFSYMKLGKTELAEKYLKMLVNEEYNSIMNAQILSRLYVSDFISGEDKEEPRRNYSNLEKRVPAKCLFPMPQNGNEDKEVLEKQFIYIQKFSLLKKYEIILNELTKRYSNRFNKCIPLYKDMKADESCFDDTYDSRVKMKAQLLNRITQDELDRNKWFINQLAKEDVLVEYMKVLQEYFSKINRLIELENNPLVGSDCQDLKEAILSPLSENEKENEKNINKFRLSILNAECEGKELLDLLFDKFSFMFFTQKMLKHFAGMITKKMQHIDNMNDIAADESRLFQFCNENSLTIPNEKYVQDTYNQNDSGDDFLIKQLLGNDEYMRIKKRIDFRKDLLELIKDHCGSNNIINRSNKSQLYIRENNDYELEQYFRGIEGNNYLKSDVLAVIEEKGLSEWFNYTDLWFTTDGLVIVKKDKYNAKYTRYGDVILESDGIKCGKIKYSNKEDVNIKVLGELIFKIKDKAKSNYQEDIIVKADFSNNCFEVVAEEESLKLCIRQDSCGSNDNVSASTEEEPDNCSDAG